MNIHGIGIDIEKVERFEKMLSAPGRLEKIFTRREIAYCKKFAHPSQRLAARFAAKEAVYKALGADQKKIKLREIEILNTPKGAPIVNLKSMNHKFHLFISLSHTPSEAIAFSIVLKG